jgi:hypothetical protein
MTVNIPFSTLMSTLSLSKSDADAWPTPSKTTDYAASTNR